MFQMRHYPVNVTFLVRHGILWYVKYFILRSVYFCHSYEVQKSSSAFFKDNVYFMNAKNHPYFHKFSGLYYWLWRSSQEIIWQTCCQMADNNNSNQKIFISLLVLIMKTGSCWNDHRKCFVFWFGIFNNFSYKCQ